MPNPTERSRSTRYVKSPRNSLSYNYLKIWNRTRRREKNRKFEKEHIFQGDHQAYYLEASQRCF